MSVPVGLGERGSRLYAAFGSVDAGRDALALEAARTADRLDELDNIIQGKGVLNLMQFRVLSNIDDDNGDRNINVEVKFGAPLAEARQQGMALSGLLKALGLGDAAESAKPAPAVSGKTPLEILRSKAQ